MLPELIELKQLRLELNLTYSALSQRLGMPDSGLVNKLIRGEHQPTELTLYKIRCFLAAHRRRRRPLEAQAS